MKPTSGHTATYKGRVVTLILLTGERVTGRFVERTLNGRIVLRDEDGTDRAYPKGTVKQFLSGQNTRGTRP